MDAVGSGDQEGEGFGGDDPSVGLIEGADARVGLFDIDEIADAIHIGLAGEEPEIADEEVLDGIERGGTGDADFDGVGAALRDAFQGAGPGVVFDAFEGFPVEAGEGLALVVDDAGFDEFIGGRARSGAGDLEIGAAFAIALDDGARGGAQIDFQILCEERGG